MSATIRRLRKERVDADAASLDVAEANLATALARRAEVQRVLDEATREAAVLEDIRDTMAGRLEASRYELVHLCVATLPDDILRCIFEAVCRADNETAPFCLAAVCARWRSVALAFSPIWSAIYSIPIAESNVMAEYNRVVTLLSRSGAAPLDVGILWGMLREASRPESVEALNKTLRAVAAHVPRWRTAQFVLPEFADASALDCLRGPSPLLTELKFSIRSEDSDAVLWSESGYLPFTPVLRSLTFGRVVMCCSSYSEFPALTKLRIGDGAAPDDVIYDYLTRSPSLAHLDLNYTISQAPRARVTLSELQSLALDANSQRLLWEPASSLLAVPKLSHLSLDCDADDAIIPFLDAVSPTVRTLDLGRPLTVHQLSILRHLENIEAVNFTPLPFPQPESTTFDQLASRDPPIWPWLTWMTRVNFADGMGESVLRLIAARNTPLDAGGPDAPDDTVRPAKLREVKFRSAAPSWLVQEAERLLRL